MTTREAFERGTDTFNAHDLAGFADVLADDVAFVAPGGVRGEGKAACAAFFGGWFGAFPDAHVEVGGLHIAGDVAGTRPSCSSISSRSNMRLKDTCRPSRNRSTWR